MKRLVLLIFILLPSCGQQSLSPRLQDIRNSGRLLVGTAITRPFQYYDETGRLVGFDIDLMNLIADRLDVVVEWEEITFADLLPELAAGRFDAVIAAMYIRDDREAIVDMSQPYLETGLVMVVRKGKTRIERFPDDLVGKVIGVKKGATGEIYVTQLLETQTIPLEIRRYSDTQDSLQDLQRGLVDVVFNDLLNSLVYTRTYPEIEVLGEPFDPAGLGIAVKSGDTELLNFINETLIELQEVGEIDRLFRKWITP